jgi:CysZ protein
MIAPRDRTQSPLQRPAERPGAKEGLRSFFAGFGFILSNPGVWPLALVPITVAVTLFGILGYLAADLIPPQIEALFGARAASSTAMGIVAWLVKALALLVALLAAALVSFGLAQPLSGPALERIVRRAEAQLGAPAWPSTSFFGDIARSLQTVLVGFAFALPLLAVLFVIDIFIPPAIVVTFPAKLVVTALMITWDLCDYPLSIRGVRAGDRVAFFRRNLRAVLGFGLGLALVSLVPCLIVLVLPAGVAGAARLVLAIERWEQSSLAPASPTSTPNAALPGPPLH